MSERAGFSWRVGVHPPLDESHLSDNAVAKAVLLKNTKPALMQIQMIEPEQEGDLPTIKLFLWKSDMVTGVIDMDHGCVVTKPACCVLHPTGGRVWGPRGGAGTGRAGYGGWAGGAGGTSPMSSHTATIISAILECTHAPQPVRTCARAHTYTHACTHANAHTPSPLRAGLLFGCADKTLMRQQLHKFMSLPGKHADALLADEGKGVKGAMKMGTTGRKIGPMRTLDAMHVDGQPVQLKVIVSAPGAQWGEGGCV